jgi:uncharacterized protein with GYD domain
VAPYILLSSLTDEGRKTLKDHPDRIRAVNAEMEAMGAHVVMQFALLGDYDFLTIVEAASNELIALVAVVLGSRGTLRVMAIPALSIDSLVDMLREA